MVSMEFSPKAILLAAPLFGLLFSAIVTTSPLDSAKSLGKADHAPHIFKRQAVDPSNVAPEDETAVEIAADGTGPLRSGM